MGLVSLRGGSREFPRPFCRVRTQREAGRLQAEQQACARHHACRPLISDPRPPDPGEVTPQSPVGAAETDAPGLALLPALPGSWGVLLALTWTRSHLHPGQLALKHRMLPGSLSAPIPLVPRLPFKN